MKKVFATMLALCCVSVQVLHAQSLAVNNDGSTADASAILDVKSSSKGLLIPRVTATSAVTSPATGLIVYVTTGTVGFYYNAGTPGTPSWKQLLPADGNGANLTSLNATNLGSGTVTAARMPALTGDVTTTAGTVATTIANNAVTTNKIADGNVTVAKISATGTASGTTYLRGDGSWSTVSASSMSANAIPNAFYGHITNTSITYTNFFTITSITGNPSATTTTYFPNSTNFTMDVYSYVGSSYTISIIDVTPSSSSGTGWSEGGNTYASGSVGTWSSGSPISLTITGTIPAGKVIAIKTTATTAQGGYFTKFTAQ